MYRPQSGREQVPVRLLANVARSQLWGVFILFYSRMYSVLDSKLWQDTDMQHGVIQ